MEERFKEFQNYFKDNFGSKLKELKHREKTFIISSIIIISIITGFFVYQNGYSYQVFVNGQELGFVKEIELLDEALQEVERGITDQFGEDAHFKKEVSYERVRISKDQLLDTKEIVEKIYNNVEVLKPAAIIAVDSQEKLVVESERVAQEILEEIKKPYYELEDREKQGSIEILDVTFGQEVKIISREVSPEEILTKEEALDKVGQSVEKVQSYEVVQGDSAWNISRSFNMGIRTLEEANPGKDMEKLMPGDKINLTIQKPFIDVITREKHRKIESIDYKIKEIKDSSLYIGQKKVKEEGKKRKKEVIMELTFLNGVEEERKIIEEKMIEEPQTRVVRVGTKARPRASSGKPAPTYNGEKGAAIVRTAKHYLGVPYVRGGSSPSGFDCSGFTSYVYRQYGIYLPRTSSAQRYVGGGVSRSNLKPGDLVIFPRHVGIYVGGGSFIHAPSTGKRVQISSLNSSYWSRRFITGRRVY